jgi:hypothetical protein
MLNVLARMIFQLIPVAGPNHFATGDVYTLPEILCEAPKHGDLTLFNQDLTGFFTRPLVDEPAPNSLWPGL